MKTEILRIVAEDAALCTECELHRSRTCSVFARGNPDAAVMFIGEAPGREENETGSPFVGAAGELLDTLIEKMGLGDAVYICNAVKCWPPENRAPTREEREACAPYLVNQIRIVQPRVIVALGRTAMLALGPLYDSVYRSDSGRWRGQWRRAQGIPVMPTYHPAFVLRNPEAKKAVGIDMGKVLKRLGAEDLT